MKVEVRDVPVGEECVASCGCRFVRTSHPAINAHSVEVVDAVEVQLTHICLGSMDENNCYFWKREKRMQKGWSALSFTVEYDPVIAVVS
jgi:hypothetical protein